MQTKASNDAIRLLCVDDELAFLELTKTFLEREGMKVTTAPSAAAAMDLLQRQAFDAVVSDYQMPGMDGLQFLDRLRRSGIRAPFILFTGKGREEVAIQALNQGADHYVQKGGEPRAQFAAVAHAVQLAVDKRAAEDAIREGEARLKATLSAAPTGIGVAVRRVITEVNDRLCEMIGYTQEELVGKSARMLYPTQEDFDYVGSEKYAQISAHGMGTVETRWKRKDGTVIDIILSSTPIKASDLAYGVVFTALDITPMKKMVRELQDSEARWKYALEGAGDGVFDWNIEEGTVYFSPRYKAILGYDEGGFGNDPSAWRDRIHPEDREAAINDLNAYLRGELPEYSMEHRLKCKDGTYKWVLARGKVVSRSEDGAPLRMIGTHSDISKRKDAEQALALSERRFLSLFSSMNEGVAIHQVLYDESGKAVDYQIIDVNNRYEKMLGLKAEDVVGKRISEVYNVSRISQYFDTFIEVAKTGHGAEIDAFFERWGKYFHISVASYAPGMFATIFFDVTEQRRMEEALKASEAQLRMLTDNMDDIVVQVDIDGKVIYISPSVRRMLGYSQDEMMGQDSSILIEPEDYPRITEEFRQAVRDNKNHTRQVFRFVKSSGERMWVETEAHILYDDDKFRGTIFVSRDITDRKRAEAAAARANAKLQLLNSLTRHDIINQVAILRGYMELDRMNAPEGSTRQRLPRRELAIQNIESMVNFMRDYQSMGESAPMWQEVATVFHRAARAFDLGQVTLELEAEGLEVFADRLLEKVFHNFIDNSLRHGGGIIRLRLSAICQKPGLLLVYEDDGKGVPEEERALIFEMGYGRNTGFGLFLAKEILELTGMSVEEAGEGKGARFVIHVPEGAWRHG